MRRTRSKVEEKEDRGWGGRRGRVRGRAGGRERGGVRGGEGRRRKI